MRVIGDKCEEMKPMSDVQEIYSRTVRPLPLQDRLRLAALILDEITTPEREQMSPDDARQAEERFARHIGSVGLGYPTGADNESIDADLAREYAATHEGED
jgi:hypothetical protein